MAVTVQFRDIDHGSSRDFSHINDALTWAYATKKPFDLSNKSGAIVWAWEMRNKDKTITLSEVESENFDSSCDWRATYRANAQAYANINKVTVELCHVTGFVYDVFEPKDYSVRDDE